MRFNIISNRVSQILRPAAALAGVSLLSGCFWLDGPQSTFDPNGPVAQRQQDLFYLT